MLQRSLIENLNEKIDIEVYTAFKLMYRHCNVVENVCSGEEHERIIQFLLKDSERDCRLVYFYLPQKDTVD